MPVPGIDKPCLFDFNVLQEYIIPRQAFCNRYITVNDPEGKCSVLGFPVSIPDPRYDRNEFIFNFGVVVDCDLVDQIPYERVVRRLAVTFAEMEKQNCYLSLDASSYQHVQSQQQQQNASAVNESSLLSHQAGRRPIESLLEIIKEDLNNYGECMIPVGKSTSQVLDYPVCPKTRSPPSTARFNPPFCPLSDDANTINMKLFPHHVAPAEVKGWHVPVAKMKFADVVDPTWDLTLQRIIPHIDGVSDVRRIAFYADVSLELTQLALRHLLYYDTILLLDMFFFGSCYAPRPGIHDFVANVGGIVDECANYVCVTTTTTTERSSSRGRSSSSSNGGPTPGSSAGDGQGSTATLSSSISHNPLGISATTTTPGGGGGGGGGRTPTPSSSTTTTTTMGARSSSSAAAAAAAAHHNHLRVSNYMLIKLMTTFCVGKTVMEWLKGHMDAGLDVLRFVDVRRLVQFGVIKGLLYRVHKHVVSKQYLAGLATGQARPVPAGGDPLQRYTDGCHTFDQIITEQNLTDAEIMDRLKSFPAAPAGDLTVLYR